LTKGNFSRRIGEFYKNEI